MKNGDSKIPRSGFSTSRRPSIPDGMTDLGSLLRRVENILTAEDASFVGLTRAAGLDPKQDFRNIYLNGIPLADQDLRDIATYLHTLPPIKNGPFTCDQP